MFYKRYEVSQLISRDEQLKVEVYDIKYNEEFNNPSDVNEDIGLTLRVFNFDEKDRFQRMTVFLHCLVQYQVTVNDYRGYSYTDSSGYYGKRINKNSYK